MAALSIQNISTEYLPILEGLMNDYFNPNLNYERKEEIKQLINNFNQQDNSFLYAIRFISVSKSDYTKIYCFSLLQNFLIKNWQSLTDQFKNELKDYFLNYLIKVHLEDTNSKFIENKLCLLLATIVRLSYPTFWPSYFNDLANLISNQDTIKLGIRLLNISLEELLQPNDELFEKRKLELSKLLIDQVPLIINMISSIMNSISNRYLGSFIITPPASPNESMNQKLTNDQSYTINLNNNKLIDLNSICKNKNLLDNIDSQSIEILELVLRCNLTLFTWLPINQFYPLLNESMLELLFIFATFGCSGTQQESKIGILSITCINELLSKNYIYNEFSLKFHSTLFETLFKILMIIHRELNLNNLDNEYLNKFIDSMRFYVTNNMAYRNEKLFFNFLQDFFNLSFDKKWCDYYSSFIEIWTNLLDIFINFNDKKILGIDENDEMVTKLYYASVELTKQILCKLQYRFNSNQLEELDNECLNDYGLTELQLFEYKSIELLSKLAKLIPDQISNIVNEFFKELIDVFINIDKLLGNSYSLNDNRLITDYLSQDDLNRLDYSLKDLIQLIHLWQRLFEHFTSNEKIFKSSLQIVLTLLDQVLNALDYSNRLKLFTIQCDKQNIVEDLNELHSSLLLLLKFYVNWINQLSTTDPSNQDNCNLLIKKICDESVRSIVITLEHNTNDAKLIRMYNDKIIQSSLLTLLSISCSSRPKFLLELPSILLFFEKLYTSINKTCCSTCILYNEFNRNENLIKHDSCLNCRLINQLNTLPSNKLTILKLEREQELIWIDICSNILILPWSQFTDQQQEWEQRSEKHRQFILSFYINLIDLFKQQPDLLNQSIEYSTISCTLKRTLFLFTNLVNNHVESQTKSKQILLSSIGEFLEFVVKILPLNILNNDLGEYILGLLICVLEVFRGLIKLNLIDQIITILLDRISNNQLNNNNNLKNNNLLIEKVFKIFIFIVEQPNATFKIILPRMLEISLNQLYHIVFNSNCFELFTTFYEFLYKFLLNNSKFFFKSQLNILNRLNNLENEQVNNEQYFLQIFEIYGNSFLQSNLDIFKQNLVALDALNYRQKLFHKKIFKDNLLHRFIVLFISTMINNEHKILNDELTSILFSLANANYELFKKICTLEFINKLKLCSTTFNQQFGQLLNENQIDLPTFNKQLNLFVNGIRYYKNSNVLLI